LRHRHSALKHDGLSRKTGKPIAMEAIRFIILVEISPRRCCFGKRSQQ
jgi:hypothetical protein